MPIQPASRKRLLLALYLNFLCYEAIYRPLAWLGLFGGILSSSVVMYFLFALSFGLGQFFRLTTPGQYALSIQRAQDWGQEATLGVRSEILARERWWTLTAGVLLVLEGSKNLVRWTHGLPPPPFLGPSAGELAPYFVICTLGALNIAAGFLIFRQRARGAWIGIGVLAAEALGILLHREEFRAWGAETLTLRRALLQRSPRPGEAEAVQFVLTTVAPIAMILGMVWLFLVYRRLQPR